MRIRHTILAAVLGISALASNGARADIIFSAPSGLAGNQNYPGTLGLNFRVNVGSSLDVTALGVFNPLSGTDTAIQTNLYAQIFQTTLGSNGVPISGVAVTPALDFLGVTDPTGAAYVFQSITPVVLGAGTYEIAAWDYNAVDKAYNQGLVVAGGLGGPITFDNLAGALTLLNSSYSTVLGSVGTIGQAGQTRFGAGSFIATDPPVGSPVPVPEPSSLSLFGAGLLGFAGFAVFRRRKQSA